MLSNATNQPKSTVELGYMCPRGLSGPPAVALTKYVKYRKRLLLRYIHHFKSDLINNMDHMRISGNEPSSVILSQRMRFKKLKSDDPKVPKPAEAIRDGVINPQITISINFNTENFDALKRYESTEVDRRTWLHVPSGTLWSTSSDTHQVVEI